ncbi:hypothetical protein NDU88_002149 [Pleurodeles waltl]|uniref:Uncharacterized protein n=1 Tax=Pleurodeles waltl TaxID=8319 RepID=A0AAV7T1A0_PLEWA|nr:hypothetical protein NDU88_002149 [Pleurodeles waltl]
MKKGGPGRWAIRCCGAAGPSLVRQAVEVRCEEDAVLLTPHWCGRHSGCGRVTRPGVPEEEGVQTGRCQTWTHRLAVDKSGDVKCWRPWLLSLPVAA